MTNIEDLTLSILTNAMVIPEFKSKDSDLNEFLMIEAKDYQEQLLAVTYLLQNPKTNEVVAYFSLLNDTIKFEEDDKKTTGKSHTLNNAINIPPSRLAVLLSVKTMRIKA